MSALDQERQRGGRALYHRFAWAYDLIIECPGGPQVETVADIFARLGLTRDSTLVDAGCGIGAYATGLASRGFAVTAVDRSSELVAQAEKRARWSGAEVEFACADLTRGWKPPRRVDGVLCRGVLNDLITDADRERAFVSFASWLRPGGALLLDVRDQASSLQRYAGGRTFEHTARRGYDMLTFTSTTTMEPSSELLELSERWVGTVDGVPVDEETRFQMRCWRWDSLERIALVAGFQTVSSLNPCVLGARGDRLVALALR
jgi:protein-L-isoaspartate O-methyltransferase